LQVAEAVLVQVEYIELLEEVVPLPLAVEILE
jgi:hypothetical protein